MRGGDGLFLYFPWIILVQGWFLRVLRPVVEAKVEDGEDHAQYPLQKHQNSYWLRFFFNEFYEMFEACFGGWTVGYGIVEVEQAWTADAWAIELVLEVLVEGPLFLVDE